MTRPAAEDDEYDLVMNQEEAEVTAGSGKPCNEEQDAEPLQANAFPVVVAAMPSKPQVEGISEATSAAAESAQPSDSRVQTQ